MNNNLTEKEIMIYNSLEDRNSMRELEQFYTDGQITTLEQCKELYVEEGE